MSNAVAAQIGRQTADAIKFASGGATITWRSIDRGTGPAPLSNPPSVEGATIATAAQEGATTVALLAEAASGQLLSGDTLIVNGVSLVVGGNAPASSAYGSPPGFPAVPLQAPLVNSIAAGAPVTFAFGADVTGIYAALRAFPMTLGANVDIQIGDLQMTIAAAGLGRQPQTTDMLIFNGATLSIVSVTPVYVYGVAVKYILQARTS